MFRRHCICKMRQTITIDARMLGYSGIGTYVANLLENVVAMGSEFEWRVIWRGPELLSAVRGENVHFLKAVTPIYSLCEQAEIAWLARGSSLLHSPHYNAAVFFGNKLLVTIHDLTHILDRTFRRTLSSIVYARPMLRLASKKAWHIVTDSQATKTAIVDHLKVAPVKVSVIHLGVSKHFHLCDRGAAYKQVSASIGIDRPYIVYVGNLRPHKNVGTLIQAFGLLRQRRKFDHQLVIVGNGSKWMAILSEEASRLGLGERISFIPKVSRELLPKIYSAADILVLPSLIEGFGLPVVEGMACGTPVICSRAASLPEVGGDAAEYFEPTSADDLAIAMERVLSSPTLQETLRAKGLERAKHFSWEECARRHFEIYRLSLDS